jgi:3-oxoacyl-[acyl-carrier protein] reductase
MPNSRKVALITGAARGLGRHLTDTFIADGYAVIVNYLTAEMSAKELIKNRERYALAVKADVGDAKQVREMLSQTSDYFGRLDIVINNAGITRDNLLLKQTEEEWDAIFMTNLTGCFHVTRAAAPLMIETGGGHIINISSYSGVKGKAGQAAYSASKAALIGLTVSAARELAEHNIRVNAMLPGYMMTAMGSAAGKAAEKAKEESLLHALIEPSAIAKSIVSLASYGYITGQIISLDSRML